jgi:predicted PurR-regulated permease PerM
MTYLAELPTRQDASPELSRDIQEPPPSVRLTPQSVPRWAVIGVFLILFVGALAYARAFLIPVVLGFLLTLVFSPVRRFAERHGVPPGLSAVLIVGALLAGIISGAGVLAEPVGKWIDNAPQIGRAIEFKVGRLLGSAKNVIDAGKKVDDATKDKNVQEVVIKDPGIISKLISTTPDMFAQLTFTLFLLLILLASGDMFYEKLVYVMPTFKDKRRAIRIVYDIEHKLSRYLFTITLINAGLGVAIGIAMWAIGMPNPLLLGMIGFVLNYVPYLGAVAGTVIVMAVGLISFDETIFAVIAGGAYLGLTAIEGQLITPYSLGRRLETNMVVIFLSIAFWAWLWSAIGMLVAVPLLVTIRVFCEHIPPLQPIGTFLSARGNEIEGEANGDETRTNQKS